MPAFKPRSRRKYLKALRDLRVSKDIKSILADIASEIEGAYCDVMNELHDTALITLYAVNDELDSRSSTKKAVNRLIKKLKGKRNDPRIANRRSL